MSNRKKSATKNSVNQSKTKNGTAHIIDSQEGSAPMEEVKNCNGISKNLTKKRGIDEISNTQSMLKNGVGSQIQDDSACRLLAIY